MMFNIFTKKKPVKKYNRNIKKLTYNPKPDITTYELALLMVLPITRMDDLRMRYFMDIKVPDFIFINGLERHFDIEYYD